MCLVLELKTKCLVDLEPRCAIIDAMHVKGAHFLRFFSLHCVCGFEIPVPEPISKGTSAAIMMISKGKEGDKTVVVLVVSLTQSAPCGTAPLYTKVYIVIEHQQHKSYDDFGKLGSLFIKDQGGGEKIQKLENYGIKFFLVNVPPSQSGKMISMEENCKI